MRITPSSPCSGLACFCRLVYENNQTIFVVDILRKISKIIRGYSYQATQPLKSLHKFTTSRLRKNCNSTVYQGVHQQKSLLSNASESPWNLRKILLSTLFNTASSATSQIQLSWKMMGSNPGLLRLWHWQSDALTTRLDFINTYEKMVGLGKLAYALSIVLFSRYRVVQYAVCYEICYVDIKCFLQRDTETHYLGEYIQCSGC